MGKIILRFIKNWTLPISMLVGVFMYFGVTAFADTLHKILPPCLGWDFITHWVQPALIFLMLFLNFSKVDPKELRPHRWHAILLFTQASLFIVCSVLALMAPTHELKVLCEGAMLCFICPTATASAVITGKLGGSLSGIVSYLLLCNLMVALIAPGVLNIVEPHSAALATSSSPVYSFLRIFSKVFPLLICPLAAAILVRIFLKRFHQWLVSIADASFYMWAVALALAIAVTVRSIMHSTVSVWYMVLLAAISLVCCVIQFSVGKSIGTHYDRLHTTDASYRVNRITAGQAFGQKNTVFVIWLGLVFLDPITSVVGGFYSVWHNVINSYQLWKQRKG